MCFRSILLKSETTKENKSKYFFYLCLQFRSGLYLLFSELVCDSCFYLIPFQLDLLLSNSVLSSVVDEMKFKTVMVVLLSLRPIRSLLMVVRDSKFGFVFMLVWCLWYWCLIVFCSWVNLEMCMNVLGGVLEKLMFRSGKTSELRKLGFV